MKKGDRVKIVKWDVSFSKSWFNDGKIFTLENILGIDCVIVGDEIEPIHYVCNEDELELIKEEQE